MKAALFAALLLITAGPASAVTVRNDNGGYIVRYIIQRNQWDERGDRVRIEGYCRSACTLYLSAKNYCVSPNARLGFHRAFFWDGSAATAATRWLISQYPPAVQAWISRKGGLRKNFITLKGRELRQTVNICT